MLNGSTSVYFYNSTNPRPTTGSENILYVDKTNKRAYVWDVAAGAYELIGTELTYQAIVDALGYTPVDQGGNTTDTGATLRTDIDNNIVRLGKIEGMDLVADMANQKILLNNSEGVLITEIEVGWLNNEGTVFSYNETTQKLELRNDQNELLAEVPVSAFVSNLAKSLAFNGTTPTSLELKDTAGNVLSTVTITIANVDGLQAALDGIAILEQVEITGLDIQTHKFTLSDTTVIETTYAPKFQVIEHPEGSHNYALRGYGVTFGADTTIQGDNFAMGYSHNVTKGYGNYLFGQWHDVIDGGAALVSGYYNQVDKGSYGAISAGAYNMVRTNYSAIFGYNNKDIHTPNGTSLNYPDGGNVVGGFNNTIAEGWAMGMFGSGHQQKGNNVLVAGQASINLNGTDKSVNVATDARFIVGNGTIEAGSYTRGTPSNAFVVYHSGLVVAPTLTNALIDTQSRALITKEYLSAFYAAGGSGSVDWTNIANKPTTFTPSTHTHAWNEITGKPALVSSVTGSAVDNTDPANPIVNIPASTPTRFGVSGEDTAASANRAFNLGGFTLELSGGKFKVNNGSFDYVDFNGTRNDIYTSGANSDHSRISTTSSQVVLTHFDGTNSYNNELIISDSGFRFENGYSFVYLPFDKGGYIPLKVNGVAANSAGEITIPVGSSTIAWSNVTGTPTTISGYGITDAYTSWNLKSNGVQRTTVQNGGTLDLVQGDNITISYSAGGVMTINATVPDLEWANILNKPKLLQVDDVQSFTDAEKKQGRDNILAEKRAEVRIPTADPTNQNFIDWESDILLVKTARTFTLPASGVLVNGSRFLVKTTATGTVQFAAADGTVTIEYNDVNATGYMAQRSEAWVLFQDDVYYVSGEVA